MSTCVYLAVRLLCKCFHEFTHHKTRTTALQTTRMSMHAASKPHNDTDTILHTPQSTRGIPTHKPSMFLFDLFLSCFSQPLCTVVIRTAAIGAIGPRRSCQGKNSDKAVPTCRCNACALGCRRMASTIAVMPPSCTILAPLDGDRRAMAAIVAHPCSCRKRKARASDIREESKLLRKSPLEGDIVWILRMGAKNDYSTTWSIENDIASRCSYWKPCKNVAQNEPHHGSACYRSAQFQPRIYIFPRLQRGYASGRC